MYTVRPLIFGGEALSLVGAPGPGVQATGGDAWVIVRRGSAIAVYGASGEFGRADQRILGPLETQARQMSDQLCRYTVAGC